MESVVEEGEAPHMGPYLPIGVLLSYSVLLGVAHFYGDVVLLGYFSCPEKPHPTCGVTGTSLDSC